MKAFASSWRLPIRHGDLVTDLTVYAIPGHFATAEPGDVVLIDDAPREVVGVCRDPFALVARDAAEDDGPRVGAEAEAALAAMTERAEGLGLYDEPQGPRLDADSGRQWAERVAAEFGIPVSELLPPRPPTAAPSLTADQVLRVEALRAAVAINGTNVHMGEIQRQAERIYCRFLNERGEA